MNPLYSLRPRCMRSLARLDQPLSSLSHLFFLVVLLLILFFGMGGYAALRADEPTNRPPRPVEGILNNFEPLPPLLEPSALSNPTAALAPAETEVQIYNPLDRVVFQSYRDRNWEIYSSDTSDPYIPVHVRLTNNSASDIHPRFNRTLDKIVFASRRNQNYDIFTMNADGSNVQLLTIQGTDDVHPDWSPDGSKILFETYREGQAEIYVMNADGSNHVRLTWDAGFDGMPRWSPDGSQIAFSSTRSGGYRIWVMNADGSNARQLSDQPYSENPVWLKDGSRIAYDADGNGDGWQDLWAMNADGSAQTQLALGGGGVDLWANSWSPAGDYVGYSQVRFTQYEGNWYWTEGQILAWHLANRMSFQIVAAGLVEYNTSNWNMDWSNSDLLPPDSQIVPLPAISPASFSVQMVATDAGGSGLLRYQLQMKKGEGTWVTVQDGGRTRYDQTGKAGEIFYFRARAMDGGGNWEAWPDNYDTVTTIDYLPPTSHILPLPPFSRESHQGSGLLVEWTGTDPGGSDIDHYEVEYQDAEQGEWIPWESTPNTQGNLWVVPGHTYFLRVRAVDKAGNVESWPGGNGDTQTAIYTWRVTGTILDNRGLPIGGADMVLTPETAVIEQPSHDYEAFALLYRDTYAIQWSKAGYGSLPATTFSSTADAVFQVALPPQDNVIAGGNFEPGEQSAWLVGGDLTPTFLTEAGHTGAQGVQLGCFAQGNVLPAQVVPVADGSSAPKEISVLDKHGVLHTAWNDSANIYYLQIRADGSKTQREQVASTAPGLPLEPQLFIDGDIAVHLFYYDNKGDLHALSRTPSGQWSQNFLFYRGFTTSSRYTFTMAAIALDGQGTVHVVDYVQGGMRYYQKSRTGGWQDLGMVPGATIWSEWPGLLADRQGNLHLIWMQNVPEQSASYYFYQQRRADGAWIGLNAFGRVNHSAIQQKLLLDDAGQIHLINATGMWNPTEAYRRLTNGTWVGPTTLTTHCWALSAYLLSNNRIGVSCETDYDARYIEGTLSGQWSEPTFWPRGTELATGANRMPFLVQLDWQYLTYRWSERAGEWSEAFMLPHLGTNGESDHPSVVIDGSNRPRATYAADNSITYVALPVQSAPKRSSISQQITVPATGPGTTLAYAARGGQSLPQGDGQRLAISLAESQSNGAVVETSLVTMAQTKGGWAYDWIDLTPWAGRTVTLTLSHESDTVCGWTQLDEVSLGSSYPDIQVGAPVLSALPGQTVTYRLAYANASSLNAADVVLRHSLPVSFTLVSATPTPSLIGDELTWSLGTLKAGARGSVALTVTAASGLSAFAKVPFAVEIETASPELETHNNRANTEAILAARSFLPFIMR